MALQLFGTSKCSLPTKSQIKEVINGCQAECDKKCVVDNYEVEIIHDTDIASTGESWTDRMCTPGRVAEMCIGTRPGVLSRTNTGDCTPHSSRSQFSVPRSISNAAMT
eukprot:CAMPEP_0169139564 /NCGR_PEP_ID=MMETSP1015-20121227/43047_1 /TAXON_ID=342587 /ORGANISM="Karlodinium micrum, Strain CCMP2283" /LENGTH=107 /DNA_ID=CAMNT_0009205299 /DNA_START=61 /DNA_END=384 /DNA_ORIENTATION=-